MYRFIESISQVLDFPRSCMQITVHTRTVLGVSQLRVPLDSQRVNALLHNSYWRVKVTEDTGSTQNDLTTKAREGRLHHGEVLATEFQSAGRGRLDRTFVTPSHSALLFSFFIEPKRSELGWLPLLAGQALCSAINDVTNSSIAESPKLKWPNDILINDKKVAGLLVERVQKGERVGVVIGIGLNVFANAQELPSSSATSLVLEGFTKIDRNILLAEILNSFATYLSRWESFDPEIVVEYRELSASIGRDVEITHPGGAKEKAFALDIDSSGALVLADGRHITVGDVERVGRK